jgi:Ala-tRNA(Pro) deacylase
MMKCRERIEQYLRENGVPFEVMTHPEVFTMQEVAAALHVPGGQVAKVVMVRSDGDMTMLVVPAPYRLDLAKVRGLLGVKRVSLAREEDFEGLFPDCETGAMPPFGNLYDIPVYVDQALAEEENVVFRVGTHQETIKIAYADYARLAHPTVGEFAKME